MAQSLVMTYRMWQRNRDMFLTTWKASVGGILLEPLFLLVAVGFGLGTLVDVDLVRGLSYGQFIAPGIIAGYTMFHASGECLWGTYIRMERQHTFDGILATPMSVEELVMGEILWGATKGVVSAVMVLAVASAFGLINSPLAVLIVPLAFLAGLMFASIGISYTSVAPSISVLENFYTLFLTPMFFFGGAFYPVENLPDAIQPVLWVLPLTPVVRLARDLALGEVGLGSLAALGLVLLYTLIMVPVGVFLMRRRLVK